jgi:hypothetical protein
MMDKRLTGRFLNLDVDVLRRARFLPLVRFSSLSGAIVDGQELAVAFIKTTRLESRIRAGDPSSPVVRARTTRYRVALPIVCLNDTDVSNGDDSIAVQVVDAQSPGALVSDQAHVELCQANIGRVYLIVAIDVSPTGRAGIGAKISTLFGRAVETDPLRTRADVPVRER